MSREQAEELAEWLRSQSTKHDYAELSVTVKIHDGKVAIVERGVTERIKPGAVDNGGQ